MVAKINTGSSLYGALSYNQEKVDEGLGKVLSSNLLCEPPDGRFSVTACATDFARWMPSPEHLPTKKPVIHISLNPHPDDKLSDSQLADIGREYMEQLGYGNQPYIIFKHEDTGREHIHIVSLRVDFEGKLIKNSFEHKRSKKITELLEQKYGLIPAEGRKQSEQWQLTPVDATQGNLKKQIASVIKPLASMYKFQTLGEYRALLSLYNIGMEEVKGEMRGKPYRGLVYCALDRDGNKTGIPLKSSLFGKMLGYDGLEKRMVKSGDQIKQYGFRERTRTAVRNAMNTACNESEFRAKLRNINIDLVLRRNSEGRIYGVTFIDHNERCVFNGSRLGKEFSANAFEEWFGKQQPVSGIRSIPLPANSLQSTTKTNIHDVGDMGENLFAFLLPDPVGNPNDDNNFVKKRKKKRKFGKQM